MILLHAIKHNEKGQLAVLNLLERLSTLPDQRMQKKTLHRAHWSIEKSCHWVIDVTFNEDQCRIRRGNGAHNFALLRQFALNRLKQEPSKVSKKKTFPVWAQQ